MLSFYDRDYTNQYRVFHIFLYSWVMLNTVNLIPGYKHLWANTLYIPSGLTKASTWLEQATNLLFLPSLEKAYPLFILIQLACSLALVCNLKSVTCAFLVWFTTVNLDNRIHVTMDGGNNLIHLLLFYSQFFINSENKGPLHRAVGVTTYYVSRVQLCLVYCVSGLCKVTGKYWTSGTALYYTFTVDEYSLPELSSLVSSYPIFSVLGSYVTLLFQISFPFLIWVRPLRKYYFLIGSFIHLGISFGMGLLSFGLAMMVAYTLFYTPDHARKVVDIGAAIKDKVLDFYEKYNQPAARST